MQNFRWKSYPKRSNLWSSKWNQQLNIKCKNRQTSSLKWAKTNKPSRVSRRANCWIVWRTTKAATGPVRKDPSSRWKYTMILTWQCRSAWRINRAWRNWKLRRCRRESTSWRTRSTSYGYSRATSWRYGCTQATFTSTACTFTRKN